MYKSLLRSWSEKMEDTNSQKDGSPRQTRSSIDNLILTAINVAAVGAGIAAAVSLNKVRDAAVPGDESGQQLDKAIAELNAKVDKLAAQLAELRQPREPQATGAEGTKDSPAKAEGAGKEQQKAADVIYVRKSSEFWFYN